MGERNKKGFRVLKINEKEWLLLFISCVMNEDWPEWISRLQLISITTRPSHFKEKLH